MKLRDTAALAGLSLGLMVTTNASAQAQQPEWEKNAVTSEKCYGVAKAGQNDCESLDYRGGGCGGHSCSGLSRKDSDNNEWLFVPTGLCARLTNGKVN